LAKPLCAGAGLHSTMADGMTTLSATPVQGAPWWVLDDAAAACAADARSFVAQVPGSRWVELPADAIEPAAWTAPLLAAYRDLSARPPPESPPAPAGLGELPVVEVTAQGSSDVYALFLSGDGGWAGLDREVAGALATHGVPVIGLDSLRYFWKAHTAQGTADDVNRILRHYASRWPERQVLLIGYSQGANVLPFVVNRLPTATRARVRLVTMMGLEPRTSFEFHLRNWVGQDARDSAPVLPEIERLAGVRALCLYGADDDEALCPQLTGADVRTVKLPGGHHFGGDYERLAQIILQAAGLPVQ
jgi:type IV secretory pathway VirJ component